MQKVVLVVLDGFGINEKTPAENAITQAKSPTFRNLFAKLQTKLNAS
jgi:bisphosphoglycerate-independent phosphoglycerate mutase (AlkP superfamily)